MRRGTRSIYVDYVDYDEIAHHAGMFRPESLGALDGLDRVLGALEKLAARGARPYRIVVLSDHGQSQGKSFHDRYGEDLPGLVARLTAEGVASYDQAVEGWGRAESLVADVGGGSGQMSKVARRVGDRVERELDADTTAESAESVVVLGSGNLGLVYVPGPERLSLEELAARWPRLVPGLAGHPGVGFVAGLDGMGTPWVLGSDGRRDLASGAVEGRDPLEPFGDHAGRVLHRAMAMREAPDLYVNSVVDPYTLDVAAFESLVGAHGGLGGWQDRAVLLAPRDLMPAPGEPIEGADALHRVLVRMLERCGHRAASPVVQPAARDGAV
jgi:hypothetical protein